MKPDLPEFTARPWRPADAPAEVCEVMELVCERHGIDLKSVVTDRTCREPYWTVRVEAIRAVAGAFPDASTPQLGRWFDGRHHTTILNALGRIAGKRHPSGRAQMVWNRSTLATARQLKRGDVIGRAICGRGGRRTWEWIEYAQRLDWLYGEDEALRRLNAATEPLKAAA